MINNSLWTLVAAIFASIAGVSFFYFFASYCLILAVAFSLGSPEFVAIWNKGTE